MLKDCPNSSLQHVLNEGGKKLSPKASHLLNTRYRDIPYLEFLDKVNVTQPVRARYYTSDEVVSFDISPKQDYMVCRCKNGSIELFSLKTGEKEWEEENCFPVLGTFSYGRSDRLHHCYSVVFHPLENVVLPGRLDKVYTITGLFQPGTFSCEGECSFSACSFSHNQTRMLTLCRNNKNQLLVWNLESDQMIKCIECLTTIISFAFSSNGKLIATTDDNEMFRVYDVEKDYAIKHEIRHSEELFIISSFKSNSWLCVKMLFSCFSELACYRFILDHLIYMKSCECKLVPVGLNAVAEVELVLLGRKRNWFKEVGRILDTHPSNCFAMLDGQMALNSLARSNYISLVNLQQLNEIKNDTGYFDAIISLDGSIVYQINRINRRDKLSVLRIQTNEFCNIVVNSNVSSFVPLKDGVLLLRENKIPELWNPHLSKCLDYFPQLVGTTSFFPISEDLVACRANSKIDILSIFNRNIVSTSSIPEESVVLACNSKYEVLIYDELSEVMSLWKNSAMLWQCWDPRLCNLLFYSSPIVSAEGDKIIVCCTVSPADLHILDASTGTYLRGHLLKDVPDIIDRCFLFVNGNIFLICACENNFLYVINVLSDELLTYLDVGCRLGSLSICLEKSLAAVGFIFSEGFKLIKVWTTNEREDKSNVLS